MNVFLKLNLFILLFFIKALALKNATQCLRFYSVTKISLETTYLVSKEFTVKMIGKTSEAISLTVPKGTGSIHINVMGSKEQLYLITSLRNEEGKFFVTDELSKLPTPSENYLADIKKLLSGDAVSIPAFLSPVRSMTGVFNNGFTSLAVTSGTNEVQIKPGKYELKVGSLAEALSENIHVRVTYKRLLPKKIPAVLPLKIFFSEARGWNEKHADFLEVIERVNRILKPSNVKVVVDAATTIPNATIIDSDQKIFDLLKLDQPGKRAALKIFFASEVYLNNYGKVYGVSTGIPGPLPAGRFKNFGIPIGLGETFSHPIHELAMVVTHEILHYLGLPHTYEIKSLVRDVFKDTSEDENTWDSNIMDPLPSRTVEYPSVSPMQINELRHHPLVVPLFK